MRLSRVVVFMYGFGVFAIRPSEPRGSRPIISIADTPFVFSFATPNRRCSHLNSLGTSERSLTASCAVESPRPRMREHLSPLNHMTVARSRDFFLPRPPTLAPLQCLSRSRGLFYIADPAWLSSSPDISHLACKSAKGQCLQALSERCQKLASDSVSKFRREQKVDQTGAGIDDFAYQHRNRVKYPG